MHMQMLRGQTSLREINLLILISRLVCNTNMQIHTGKREHVKHNDYAMKK